MTASSGKVKVGFSTGVRVHAVQQVGQRRYMLRLVVSEVLDHAKGIPREDTGVHRHGVELCFEIFQREGEVRDVYVVGLGGACFDRSIEAAFAPALATARDLKKCLLVLGRTNSCTPGTFIVRFSVS